MSSPSVRDAARRLVPSLALVLAAGCAPASTLPQYTRYTMTPIPDPVSASLLMRMNAEQEAAVLEGIAPVLPPLLARVWGVPAQGTPWRLEVMMTPWRMNHDGGMSFWVDSSDATTARDRARLAFRRSMETSLTPPAPSRAWYVGDMRGVSVQQARTSGDSLLVQVDVSAGMRCEDGRNVMRSVGYEIAFIHEKKGSLHRVEQAPQFVAESGQRADSSASCAPRPLVARGSW